MSHPHNTNTNRSKKEEVATAFDSLIPSLEAISAGFKDMHKQMEKLKRVNDNLVEFNDSFGAFLFGLAANDTTVKWRSPTTESEIAKHKKHLQQLHTHEATRAVQLVKQPHHTATAASSSSAVLPPPVATAAAPASSFSTKAKTASRLTLKRHIAEKSSETARKKPRTAPEVPKQLVSNRRFEPKVNVASIINRLPIKYQDRGAPHDHMTSVLKILGLHPEGLTARKLSAETKLAQRFITDCVNTLVFRKEVIKVQEEGQYARYLFDPARFPSVPK